MQNLLSIPALVLAAREAKIKEEKTRLSNEAEVGKKRHDRRCIACNRRNTKSATASSSQWYPVQGAGPQTACRFTIKHTREIIVGVGPSSYHNQRAASAFAGTLNKVTSTRGVSLGARLAPLFYQRSALKTNQSSNAAPSRYNIERFPRKTKTNLHPFNSSTTRQPVFTSNEGPGPGSYEVVTASRDRRIPFMEHLGSGRTMIAAVRLRCVPASDVLCDTCGDVPRGDYWKARTRTLCRECKREEQSVSPKRIKSAPHPNDVLKKVRNCDEVHCHEGTGAAIRLRTERQQQRARVREAYLSLYFP